MCSCMIIIINIASGSDSSGDGGGGSRNNSGCSGVVGGCHSIFTFFTYYVFL